MYLFLGLRLLSFCLGIADTLRCKPFPVDKFYEIQLYFFNGKAYNRAINKSEFGGITMLLAIHLFVVAVFAILGIVFLNGKGSFLIAGYNTASKAQKEKIDKKKLCNYTGKLMFVLAGCFLIIAASEVFGKMWLLWTGLVLFFIALIGGVVFMNTGNRLKK